MTQPVGQARVAGSPGARAWELMYDVLKASKPYMESVAAAFELTPQQMAALKILGNERPMAMSELATALGCDASNVTAIVDKLESRGLVERRSADHDRRVKALVVTASGNELRDRIRERMQQPPPAIDNLSDADLEALCAILGRALDSIS
jgi:DNA-binding MarR family transcriptional regulator